MRVSLVRLAAGSAIAFASVIVAACTGQTPTSGAGVTTGQCDAEYAANIAAIKASGQTKRAFIAACRAGNATFPQSTAGAPPPPPLPPPPPPPSWWPTTSLF